MAKNRLDDILRDYWEVLRGDRLFPARDDIDSKQIASIWQDCFVIEVFPMVNKNGYRFTHKGGNLSEGYENDQGSYISNLVVGFLDSSTNRYDEVVRNKKPFYEDGVHEKDGHDLKFRQILLPFGEGDKVTTILGGMRLLKSET